MAKKSKSKKLKLFYLAAILFSALVIAMAFVPMFGYKVISSATNVNGFELMHGVFAKDASKLEGGSLVINGLTALSAKVADNLTIASVLVLATICLAGISVLLALTGLLSRKNFRMIQFVVLALCFAAALAGMIMLFVAGENLKNQVAGEVITKGIVNVGAYLMTLFALAGAGTCLALKK